jgi:SPX domain protein involved in polyphosphate accumulation
MSIRVEKKYTFNISDKLFVNDYIKGLSCGLRNVYKKRTVNSIYFDSNDLSSYEENLLGGSKRIKARIRWYSQEVEKMNILGEKIYFELKIKQNKLGNKFSFPLDLKNFQGSKFISNDQLISTVWNCVPTQFRCYLDSLLEPTLRVSYSREYYESFSGLIRVTVDDQLSFSRPDPCNLFNKSEFETVKMEYGVLEAKISVDADSNPLSIDFANGLIREGRHSKYAVGINSIYG